MDIDTLLERLDTSENEKEVNKVENNSSSTISRTHLKDKEVRQIYQATTKRLADASKRAERSKRDILKRLKEENIDYKELATISIMAIGLITQDYPFMKEAEERLVQ